MEENLFPSQMSQDSPRGLEEERRLFYVAITRAEEYLILTNAKSRFRYGKTEFGEPSRFLREIDPRFLRVKGEAGTSSPFSQRNAFGNTSSGLHSAGMYTSAKPSVQTSGGGVERNTSNSVPTGIDARRFVRVSSTSRQTSPSPSETSVPVGNVSVGTRIQHDRFGNGVITAIEGQGVDTKATVSFENVGTKQLLLRFAKFKVL
jgi:DNA helicase-2/ATP-dependent DNA helicase PcrA